MDALLSFAVSLLTAALSLLGFVQQHPELPPSARDQAQQVAQQAIGQATNLLAGKAATPPQNSVLPVAQKIQWSIAKANPAITNSDDFRQYEQVIMVDVTFSDGSTRRHDVGKAYGCSGTNVVETASDGKRVLGRVNCYFAATGANFVAYSLSGRFIVERHDDDASGQTSGRVTKVLDIAG